ncbi:HydE/PylB-like protein, partial [Aduncisulcus paluster]
MSFFHVTKSISKFYGSIITSLPQSFAISPSSFSPVSNELDNPKIPVSLCNYDDSSILKNPSIPLCDSSIVSHVDGFSPLDVCTKSAIHFPSPFTPFAPAPIKDFSELLEKDPSQYTVSDLIKLLSPKPYEQDELLFKAADKCCREQYGGKVFLRGIIEFSNICRKNCLYCGIRKDSKEYSRFVLDDASIYQCIEKAIDTGYPGILLQSGEVLNETRIDWLCDICRGIKRISKEKTGKEMTIILSIGELTKEQYQKLYDAGADRYLLRIETSDRKLFKTIHPDDKFHSFDDRI